MLWSARKHGLLKKVGESLHKPTSERGVKYNVVINLIEQCIAQNRDAIINKCTDIDFNPLIDIPLIFYILKNFWIMDLFPEHKKLIKKILS
jgi:hypothetical protein